eukprot:4255327-Amphidinium_carterae.1
MQIIPEILWRTVRHKLINGLGDFRRRGTNCQLVLPTRCCFQAKRGPAIAPGVTPPSNLDGLQATKTRGALQQRLQPNTFSNSLFY